MEVNFTPDVEAKLEQIARDTGHRCDELVATVVAEYFDTLSATRETLDRRYDEIKNGFVAPVEGEEVFARLRAKSEARRTER
jgi:hypothetical protein